MRRDTQKRISIMREEQKKKNEDTFVTYLLEKKDEEKLQKQAMRINRASEARGCSDAPVDASGGGDAE